MLCASVLLCWDLIPAWAQASVLYRKAGLLLSLVWAPVKQWSSISSLILKLIACQHSHNQAPLHPIDRWTRCNISSTLCVRRDIYQAWVVHDANLFMMTTPSPYSTQVKVAMSMFHNTILFQLCNRCGHQFHEELKSLLSALIRTWKILCYSATWFKPQVVSPRLNALMFRVLRAWTWVSARKGVKQWRSSSNSVRSTWLTYCNYLLKWSRCVVMTFERVLDIGVVRTKLFSINYYGGQFVCLQLKW